MVAHQEVYMMSEYICWFLPSLDYLIQDILDNPKLIKVDIVRVFHNVRIDLADALKLCVFTTVIILLII